MTTQTQTRKAGSRSQRGGAAKESARPAPASRTARDGVVVWDIVPHLTFPERAEEAIRFYCGVFRDARIIDLVHGPQGADGRPTLLWGSFELKGREFSAMDGGPDFGFSPGFSIAVTCERQEEIDELWERLGEGGEHGKCGWLKDRYGVSWQVVPRALGEMMSRPQYGDTKAVMEAMLKMGKLEIAPLREAYGDR